MSHRTSQCKTPDFFTSKKTQRMSKSNIRSMHILFLSKIFINCQMLLRNSRPRSVPSRRRKYQMFFCMIRRLPTEYSVKRIIGAVLIDLIIPRTVFNNLIVPFSITRCNLCIFIFMSTYSYCMFMYLHRASWHSSATLTEGFPCFSLSCIANARVKPVKTGTVPHSSKMFVLFYVLFVLCRSVYCLCVNVSCTTATGWLPNCS
jgi:hypothetical protein